MRSRYRGFRLRSRRSLVALGVGVVLFVFGAIGIAGDLLPGAPTTGLGLQADVDLGVLGVAAGVGAVVSDRLTRSPGEATTRPVPPDRSPVYVTRSLLDTLLGFADDAEPESLSIGLAVTLASDLTGVDDLPETTPVFTHLYFPGRPNAVSSVFGFDLQTPPGRTHGRFVTHPLSDLRLTKRDDLHEVVIVAVPPWDDGSVAAFDRRGRRRPVSVVDAVPPRESLPGQYQ